MAYSARPDGRITIEEFICMIPADQKRILEDDLNRLLQCGWGEIVFSVINKTISGHQISLSRKYSTWKK